MAIAERIRSCSQRDGFLLGNVNIKATVSLRVAAAQGESADVGSLLAAADTALSLAKSRGGNRVECAFQVQAGAASGQ